MLGASDCGVLIDFDSAYVIESSGNTGRGKRTGTIPFMALELLADMHLNNNQPHLYRHDVESFIWTFAFVLLNETCHRVQSWLTSDPLISLAEKTAFLELPLQVTILLPFVKANFEAQWPLVIELLTWLEKVLHQRREYRGSDFYPEPNPEQIFKEVCAIIEKYLPEEQCP